jgi:hypothetical protein
LSNCLWLTLWIAAAAGQTLHADPGIAPELDFRPPDLEAAIRAILSQRGRSEGSR